jgi:hypothetical protein
MANINKNKAWILPLVSLAAIVFLVAGPGMSSGNYRDSEASTNNLLRINVDTMVPVTRTLYPNGAGAQANCTRFPNTGEANWQNVDESVTDEDSTYNEASSTGWIADLYTLTQISAFSSYTSGTLAWVQAWMRAKGQLTPSTANASNHIRTGGAEYDATAVLTTTSYANYSNTWSINPQTSGAWTWADLNALQAGMNLCESKNGHKYTRVTQVWVVIKYIAPWNSYNDSGWTVLCSNFSGSYKTVYMKGTNFSAADYNVAYYDAGTSGGQKVASQTITVAGDGLLLGSYYFPTLPLAVAGTWHALVQPASGYSAFPASYNSVTSNQDTYGLVANDSFIVDATALN